MPRFKLVVEYAGTRYRGWQIQKNARTVQGEIEKAIAAATGRRDMELYGSGRTDAGVHAAAQAAHLEIYTTLNPEQLRRRINDELPADIHVRTVAKAAHMFHARHDARARSYVYQLSRRRTAFAKPFVWWVREPLDIRRMREAAALFTGMRDFAAFTDDDSGEKSTKVLVDRIELVEAGALILVRVLGSHFLWKMVRRMVGVLAAVGRGDLSPSDAQRLLDGGEVPGLNATPASLTAPAAGLFLEAVYYDGDPPPGPLVPIIAVE
jgi:tRNA pseudouridine38-40 synthase